MAIKKEGKVGWSGTVRWSDVADRRLEINTKERQYKSSDDASGAGGAGAERGLTPNGEPEPNLSPLKKENRRRTHIT